MPAKGPKYILYHHYSSLYELELSLCYFIVEGSYYTHTVDKCIIIMTQP